MRICNPCSIKRNIYRIANRNTATIGICPICREYRSLAIYNIVDENTGSQSLKRVQDLAAIRAYDGVLARGGE